MSPLLRIARAMARGQGRAVLRGMLLALGVLAMGAALLGLSGWFITAAGAAGLAGAGALFNVFVPSSMVRFLALGRTAARYGERIFTHDATLRGLARLRVDLMRGLLTSPFRQLDRLRATTALNRLTADVDALDGVLLRLVIPACAGAVVLLGAGAVLAWLVHPLLALWIVAGWLVLPTLTFALGQRLARKPARRTEAALQAMRARMLDLLTAREDLLVQGRLDAARAHVATAIARHDVALAGLERTERRMGLALDLTGTLVLTGTLALGARLAQDGAVTVPGVALASLAALALGEATAPVRRALSELGRMTQAARRVLPLLDAPPAPAGPGPEGVLRLDAVTGAALAPVTLTVAPGQTVALTGPSGRGKSTVLLIAAGVLRPDAGRVTLGSTTPEDEATWRRAVIMLPQRHALIAGSVRDNLALAGPTDDADCHAVLRAVALDDTLATRDGLETRLGFRGAGLSGGESRRLALARAILTRPRVLLLDEPTEGLDHETARRVMTGLRAALPDTAILIAAHRAEDIAAADCVIALQGRPVTAR